MNISVSLCKLPEQTMNIQSTCRADHGLKMPKI